jgi:hypothetical protein
MSPVKMIKIVKRVNSLMQSAEATSQMMLLQESIKRLKKLQWLSLTKRRRKNSKKIAMFREGLPSLI